MGLASGDSKSPLALVPSCVNIVKSFFLSGLSFLHSNTDYNTFLPPLPPRTYILLNMFKTEKFKLQPRILATGWPQCKEAWGYCKASYSFLTGRVGGGGQGNDKIADSKYIRQVNTRGGAEVFKLKDDAGTRTDDYKCAKTKFRQETRNFLTV